MDTGKNISIQNIYQFMDSSNEEIIKNFDSVLGNLDNETIYELLDRYITGRNNISSQIASKFISILNMQYIDEYKRKSEKTYRKLENYYPTPIHEWLCKYGTPKNEKYFPALIKFMYLYSTNITYKGDTTYELLFKIISYKNYNSRDKYSVQKQLENNNLTIQELSRLAFDYLSNEISPDIHIHDLFKHHLNRLEKSTGKKQYLRNVVCGINSYHNALYEFITKNIGCDDDRFNNIEIYYDLFDFDELSSDNLTIRDKLLIRNEILAYISERY